MLVQVIRPVPQAAVDFVKAHEGCRLDTYLDGGGVVTVGYGHTAVGLRIGQTITQQQADDFLRQDLATAAQRLEDAVGEACVTELTENQYAALLSFTFNVGINPAWSICKALKAKQFDQIPGEMMRFVNAGGRKLQGLVNRRADEVKLWSTDEPGSVPDDPSSSFTRAAPTPPTDALTKPLSRSKSWFAGLTTAGLAFGNTAVTWTKGAAQQVNDAISPYAGSSVILQHIQGAMTLALAGSALALVVLLWLKNREAKSQ